MEEQPVIFDETFDAGINERRRAIMPLGLKVYVWIGMVFGAFFSICPFLIFLSVREEDKVPISNGLAVVAVSLPFGILVFMMTFLLWSEVKWAIRFNWIIGAIWALPVIFGFAVNGAGALRYLLGALLFVPYWVWLYRIQERWEKTGVSGKQLKAATLK